MSDKTEGTTEQDFFSDLEDDAGEDQPKGATRKKRSTRPFPACAFEDALSLARAILDFGSGQPVRRISLFDHLDKSPESGTSRQWITNANKYGLIRGSYAAEQLELTADGLLACSDDVSRRDQASAQIRLAVTGIAPFDAVYQRFVGNKLPARAALIDAMGAGGVPLDLVNEGVDTLIVNLRFVGLLQTMSGAERILTVDHLLETLPPSPGTGAPSIASGLGTASAALITRERAVLETTCFYVTPIDPDGSEWRKHSDLILGAIIEPALEPFGMTVVRADLIDKPGLITRQIVDHLLKARLVIADLSFHNPNVFYELAVRHAARLPAVQIIRSGDTIPFDLGQVRTIQIDTTDLYTFVPRIESYRSEVANQVRRALDDPDAIDNPLSAFYPDFKISA